MDASLKNAIDELKYRAAEFADMRGRLNQLRTYAVPGSFLQARFMAAENKASNLQTAIAGATSRIDAAVRSMAPTVNALSGVTDIFMPAIHALFPVAGIYAGLVSGVNLVSAALAKWTHTEAAPLANDLKIVADAQAKGASPQELTALANSLKSDSAANTAKYVAVSIAVVGGMFLLWKLKR